MNNKLKIVWLCPLPLNDVADIHKFEGINLDNERPYPWTINLLEEFRKKDNVELHVITRSNIIKHNDIVFKDNNVKYYFLKRSLPLLPRRFYNSYINYDVMTHYYFFVKKVQKIINSIAPHIINSIGTENEYSYILNGLGYPSLVTIGGFISSVINQYDTYLFKKRLNFEIDVFKKQKNFAIRNEFMKQTIAEHNNNANYYYYYFPLKSYIFDLHKNKPNQDFDFVFAANLAKDKGIEDLIIASSIIKERGINLKVKIIGFGVDSYIDKIKKMIAEKNLNENVIFKGFLPNHADVFNEINSSKICVLPTYFDTSPGTVCEAMSLKVPVIAYNTDGLPYMIKNNINGVLVEKFNINKLADSMIELLNDPGKRNGLAEKAFEFAIENFWGPNVFKKVMDSYNSILNIKRTD